MRRLARRDTTKRGLSVKAATPDADDPHAANGVFGVWWLQT